MSQKSMMYDHPAYIARGCHSYGALAATGLATSGKFLAFTAMHVFALHVTTETAGATTYTGWNGTATVTATGTGDQISGVKVTGTASTTYGPYVLDAAAGGFRRIQIYQTGVGSATSDGGVALAAGDRFLLIRGTDTTGVQVAAIEYAVDPFASVSA